MRRVKVKPLRLFDEVRQRHFELFQLSIVQDPPSLRKAYIIFFRKSIVPLLDLCPKLAERLTICPGKIRVSPFSLSHFCRF
ncbi:hypothetical protein [Negativicoccus succinicivorans]|uniref:hypothetical protein n=1 Tax=Negativicoccus succinicivorans TaxID=620903 RepID=UPI0023534047|nr:hypothetical protein [Negativicoccus succinicivorans]